MSFSVLDNKISNLVEEHGAKVIFLQEVVRHQPGVIRHVVRQLHGGPPFVHVNGEDVIVFLRPDDELLGKSSSAAAFSVAPERFVLPSLRTPHS